MIVWTKVVEVQGEKTKRAREEGAQNTNAGKIPTSSVEVNSLG